MTSDGGEQTANPRSRETGTRGAKGMQTQQLDKLMPAHLDWELELIVQLGDEQVVAQRLPHLHDPDDGGVDLVLPVLEHALRGADLLLHLRERARRPAQHRCRLWGAAELRAEGRPDCGGPCAALPLCSSETTELQHQNQ